MYLLNYQISSGTVQGGGELGDFRGVFQDELPLVCLAAPPNESGVPLKNAAGQAFIIGNEGLTIPGYSDDATLTALYPFASPVQIADKRREITAGRVLLTLHDTTPADASYTVSYTVYGDTGVKNVDPGPVGYLVLGDLNFTYDEDTDYAALLASGRSI